MRGFQLVHQLIMMSNNTAA